MTIETNKPVPAFMSRIRTQIRTAEAKADESLIAKLDLMRSLLHARQTEEMPAPHVGQDAIVRIGRAISSDISSANDIFRSHNALVDAQSQITGQAPGHGDTLAFVEGSERREAAAA